MLQENKLVLQTAYNISESAAMAEGNTYANESRISPVRATEAKILPYIKKQPAQNFSAILQKTGRGLLISDIMALILAFICGGLGALTLNLFIFKGSFQQLLSIETLKQFVIFVGLGGLALLWLDTRSHYRQRLPYWETVGHILSVAFIGFLVCGFIQFVAQSAFSRLWLGLSWVLFTIFLFTGRSMVRRGMEKSGQWHIPAIMIGNGPSAEAALNALSREPQMGFNIIRRIPCETLQQLVEIDSWHRMLAASRACHIFLALEGTELEKYQPALKNLVRERLPCSIVPPWLGLPSGTMSAHHFVMHDVVLLHDTNRLYLPLPCFLKRSFDLICASAALLALSPIFIALALGVRSDGGPAFFKQNRVGRKGEKFLCYKFRSMRIDAEDVLESYLSSNAEAAAEWQKYQKLKNDVRITRFGNFIRRTSLDELPQLINVVKGDMSLVGPRPIMPGQEVYYADDFIYYESVRPGITGPWQVSGRNTLTFKERVALESCYTRNWSLWMDIVILLKTLPALMKKEQAF
jgi:Undecaprenyl-phosphate galactose phosphotransferase WbaP